MSMQRRVSLGRSSSGRKCSAEKIDDHDDAGEEKSSFEESSSSLTSTAESEEFLLEMEEIPRLLMVDLKQEKAKDVLEGLKALADHLRPENRHCHATIQEAVEYGAPSILVSVMRRWHNHELVQTVCCCCALYLSCHEGSRSEVAKAYGLDAIVDAMIAYPTSNGIQFSGCGAIMKSLAAVGTLEGATCEEVRNAIRRFIFDMDGVSVVLRAMIQFRKFSGFQAICCEALDKLASDGEFYQLMMQSNVVNAVATTLDLHGEDETISVREHASRFMLKKMLA